MKTHQENCPKSPTGHEPNWDSLTVPPEAITDEFLYGVVDVNCKFCGRSGSVRVNKDEINWE